MNKKIITVTLLIIMSLAVAFTPVAMVHGQSSSLGVSVIALVQASQANSVTTIQNQDNGTPGMVMNLKGTIYTAYGTYNVIIGNTIVASGTADDLYVDTNFTVPQLPYGDYTFVLEDIQQQDLNSTGNTPITFDVLTSYTITPSSAYLLEGGSESLNVAVEGGTPNTSYVANVTVEPPSALDANYSEEVSLGTANSQGTASSQITFPSSSFQLTGSTPSGSITDYVGTYNLYFNQSTALGTSSFTVGFLDSQTYHRGQTLTVTAQGYSAGQTATFAITDSSGASLLSQSVTASSGGVISTTWVVPSNIAIGNYNATITTTSGTPKTIQDLETFSVPGYAVAVTTVNLAGQPVSSVSVQALDLSNSQLISNQTSNYDGVATLSLEPGNYILTAFYENVNVGTANITVTGAGNTFTFQCQLTDLTVVVQNEAGTALPFVNLNITYTAGSKSEIISGETDAYGTYTLNSTLTSTSYTIVASLYNQVFNSDNETVSSLPVQANSTVVVICPTESLTINVVGYSNQPIPDATLKLVELTTGLFYNYTADSSGSVTAPVTFGEYDLQIYQNSILLNQSTVDAFSNNQYQIRCTLYGIQVSVTVVDYFGTPISNVNVTINGPASEHYSATTTGNGKATFSNIIGGNLQILASPSGAPNDYQALALTVDQPTSIQIRMDRYVVFGSLLIPTSALLTVIIIIAAIIVLAAFEIYWRRIHRTSAA